MSVQPGDTTTHNAVHSKWQHYIGHYLGQDKKSPQGMKDAADAWETLVRYMSVPSIGQPPRRFTEEDTQRMKAAIHVLVEKRWMPATLDFFTDHLQDQDVHLKAVIDTYMNRWRASRNVRDIYLFINCLCELHTLWCPPATLGAVFPHRYHRIFMAMLHSILPDDFVEGFRDLLTYLLTNSPFPPTDNPDEAAIPECTFPHPDLPSLALQDPNPVVVAGPPSPYAAAFGALDVLGFLERYESQLTLCVNTLIDHKIQEVCPGSWDQQLLPGLKAWLMEHIIPYLSRPYARGLANPDEVKIIVSNIVTRLDYHLCKTLCNLRMTELFDIIVDYPDSMPALLDIKECLSKVDERLALVKELRRLNNRRLLHPGADTKDILSQYVSTIRCLRVIDPPGVLLYKVADPIRRYLRERPDTIRNIVASLVGEGGDLLDESDQTTALQPPPVDDYLDPNWEPEPIDSGPDFRANKPADVLTTLVSIYDSKDLFVKELQILLAQRLLAIKDGNYDRERKNIEILKIRFGDAALQVCEVMLRDMTDSRRIDQHIQAQKESPIHLTVISGNFWPSLQTGGLKMLGQYQSLQEDYSKEFVTFKPDKQLRWLPHLGSIQLEIELQDRKIETEATPLEAAIIELFSEKDTWTVDDILPRLGSVDLAPSVKALNAWADKGVLVEESEACYKLLEVASEDAGEREYTRRQPVQEEELPNIVTMQQQQAEQMKVHWKFVQGMLTNIGALPLDRIHSMLNFAAPNYDRTPEQLLLYLESAKREGQLTMKDGLWSLTPEGKAGK
ncbi:hypothetical protein M422DRAFT_222616 [Sphaerobolus stellatus SS14]|nr:hypothetical protein M422DRAFT_222616 [Sphaerobolus stellatus SS14]